jgi:hypothetical protein
VFPHPSPVLSDAVITVVRQASPFVRPVFSQFEPVVGALFLALEAAGRIVDPATLGRVAASLPPRSFYATLDPALATCSVQ